RYAPFAHHGRRWTTSSTISQSWPLSFRTAARIGQDRQCQIWRRVTLRLRRLGSGCNLGEGDSLDGTLQVARLDAEVCQSARMRRDHRIDLHQLDLVARERVAG